MESVFRNCWVNLFFGINFPWNIKNFRRKIHRRNCNILAHISKFRKFFEICKKLLNHGLHENFELSQEMCNFMTLFLIIINYNSFLTNSGNFNFSRFSRNQSFPGTGMIRLRYASSDWGHITKFTPRKKFNFTLTKQF